MQNVFVVVLQHMPTTNDVFGVCHVRTRSKGLKNKCYSFISFNSIYKKVNYLYLAPNKRADLDVYLPLSKENESTFFAAVKLDTKVKFGYELSPKKRKKRKKKGLLDLANFITVGIFKIINISCCLRKINHL